MTMPEKAFSDLLGNIYDATLDPSVWQHVMAGIVAFVGGQSAGMGTYYPVSKNIEALCHFGCDPHYLQLQVGVYAGLDPHAGLFFFPPEQVVSIADIMPYDQYLDTRFYREWAQPQGWIDSACAVLDKSATSFSMLGVYRNAESGRVDDLMRNRMQMIVPHVRRAVLISRVIDLKVAEAARFSELLDGLSAAILFVDAKGRIVHANSCGHEMLAEGQVLSRQQDYLSSTDPNAARALREAIACVENGDFGVGNSPVALSPPLQADGRWLAHVLPLTSGLRQRVGAAYSAAAVLFVQRAALDTPSAMEAVAKLYRLTPTEVRVLRAVVELGGVSPVAGTLGISEATVKSHLQHLFEKTGIRRQMDLVKLVAGHASPLRA